MHISLKNTGKRYNREWIFRHLDYEFVPGGSYAITGNNGSGKSTLLQVIAGSTIHSEGTLSYDVNGISVEEPYKNLAIAAPYLELVEEMTATEFLQFHHAFKPLFLSTGEILSTVGLGAASNKQVRYFSSGMKQRLKLAQAFFSQANLLLLDEPLTNLDADGISLYHELINRYTSGRTVIVSSNDKTEYEFCNEIIPISRYK